MALYTAPNTPEIFYNYVDDTFTKTHAANIDSFTGHVNSIGPHNFFFDTYAHMNEDGSTKTTANRKPTYTNQKVNFTVVCLVVLVFLEENVSWKTLEIAKPSSRFQTFRPPLQAWAFGVQLSGGKLCDLSRHQAVHTPLLSHVLSPRAVDINVVIIINPFTIHLVAVGTGPT